MFKLGFSLIELLITLSIAIILFAVAIPLFKFFFIKSTDQVMSLQLFRAINLARSEALASGQSVTLCKSANQQTCIGEWKEGYLIHSGNKILYVFHTATNDGILHWRAFPKSREDLQFLPSGFSRAENGSFWYCHSGATNASWAIVISQTGRARMVYPNKMGNVEIENSTPLKC